jgi:hypothetical protein
MTDILAQYETSLLPPELMLNEDHPDSDPYIQSTRRIQQMIVAQSASMPYKAVQMAKLAHTGLNKTEIGHRLNVSGSTVSKHLKKDDSKRLLALMSYYDAAIEGPHLMARKNMLWRIARKNEIEDPRVAISALSELGKYDAAQNDLHVGGGTTQIIINTQQLPRGTLDGEFTEVTDQGG